MRVLVTGASGMLGGALMRELIAREAKVIGCSHHTHEAPDGLGFRAMDLARRGAAEWLIEDVEPDVIFHCAALTDADAIEDHPVRAREVNAVLPGRIARAAAARGARLVYVSTDAVYDGDRPGLRREAERPRPLSTYARTKLEGEDLVLNAHPEALVARTTMVGWTLPGKRVKLAEWIVRALERGEPIGLFEDAYLSPLYVVDLARTLMDLVEVGASGVLNVGCERPLSRWNLGGLIAEALGVPDTVLRRASVADAGLRAGRPRNVGLDVSWATALVGEMRSPEDTVEHLVRDYRDGVYPLAGENRGRARG